MTLTDEDLRCIVDDVVASFVGAPLADPAAALAATGAPREVEDTTDLGVSACVSIAGAWTGSVVVTCSLRLARVVAAAMLMAAEEDLVDEDVTDAMGEIANMVGGSVKAHVAEPSVLSLPVVTHGPSHGVVVPGSERLLALHASCAAEPLQVLVLGQVVREDGGARAARDGCDRPGLSAAG